MDIESKIKEIEKEFYNTTDLIVRKFESSDKIICAMLYLDNAVDKLLLSQCAIEKVQRFSFGENPNKTITECQQNLIAFAQVEKVTDKQDIIDSIINGFAILIVNDCEMMTKIGCSKWVTRYPSEPPTSAVIQGPREGFVEDINSNISLIRKRMRSNEFVVEDMTLGQETNTQIKICYLHNVAKPTIIQEIKEKLKKIKIDGIVDSSYIAAFLGHNRHSLFKQIGTSEKPDMIAAKVLEGRVAIFVDGSPIVLTIPFLLFEDLQSSDDYYSVPAKATFLRWLRLFGAILAIMLPGIYVSLLIYHYQIIPIKFLITIANAIEGIPLPPFLEILFIIFLFEILYEASLRMPRYLGLALSIVGALILGDTAVKAGLISPPAVLIIAITGVMSYTIPEQSAQITLLRLIFTFIGGALGLFGITAGSMVLIVYLSNMNNYQTPYLAPFGPFIPADQKDGLIKSPITSQINRPESIPNINKRRLKDAREDNSI